MLIFFKNNIMSIFYAFLSVYTLFVLFYTLYKKLNLKISLMSIVCFYINVWIIIMFIISFILALRYKQPIYLENISLFAQYKYLTFTIIVFSLVVLFLINKIYPLNKNNTIISFVIYPYLKKQVNDILDCFVESYLSDIYEIIFQKVYKSKRYKVLFFLIHFLFIHGIRLINTLIFLNFVLFHGNLRVMFLLIPLTLVGWLLQYIEYHFITYMETVSEESKRLFSVTIIQQESSSAKSITLLPKHVEISITAYGKTKGLTVDYINQYHDQWILLMNFKYKFNLYKNRCFMLDRINLIIRIICWIIITNYFFYRYVV